MKQYIRYYGSASKATGRTWAELIEDIETILKYELDLHKHPKIFDSLLPD